MKKVNSFSINDIEIKTNIQSGIGRHSGEVKKGLVVQMRYKDEWISCGMEESNDPNKVCDYINTLIKVLFASHKLIEDVSNE